MESRASRRHRAQEGQAQETEPPQEKKKVKKGILKNSGKHNSKSSSQPGPGDYDVPNSGGGGGPAAKSHRNLSSSCDTIDQLEGEAGYSQLRERSRRRHREVEDVNIYDTPKVTSVKWKEDLAAAYDMLTKNSKHGLVSAASSEPSFYENVGFNVRSEEPDSAQQQLQDNEGVYDFPRPRTVDAVYFNDNFEDEGPTYDTPRKQDTEIIRYNDEDLNDTSEGEYDVPKVRDTLETIEEEESQEYDVPRNNRMVEPAADTAAGAAEEEEENLYENQQFVVLGAAAAAALLEHEPIYMNELADDRSSGYRSSSSPSINSEENLYENGAMLMDDFSSQGSQGSQV